MNAWSLVVLAALPLLADPRQAAPANMYSARELTVSPSGALVGFRAECAGVGISQPLGILNLKDGRVVAWTYPLVKDSYDLPIRWFPDERRLLFYRTAPDETERPILTPSHPFILDAETGKAEPLNIQGAYCGTDVLPTGANEVVFFGSKDQKGSQSGLYLARQGGKGWTAEPVLLQEKTEKYLGDLFWAKKEGAAFRVIALEGLISEQSLKFCSIDVEDGKPTRRFPIIALGEDICVPQVSADGRWLAVERKRDQGPSEVLLMPTSQGEGPARTFNLDLRWFRISPSGRSLLLWENDPPRLAVIDTSSSRRQALDVLNRTDFIIEAAWLSDDEIVVSVGKQGIHRMYRLSIEAGDAQVIWEIPTDATWSNQASERALRLHEDTQD